MASYAENVSIWWRYHGTNYPQHVTIPNSKVHGATMGPTWVRQDPGRPHVGPMLISGEFSAQRPVTRIELWCFSDLRLNKRLSKQSWGWWFETLSSPLWRHWNPISHINGQAMGCIFWGFSRELTALHQDSTAVIIMMWESPGCNKCLFGLLPGLK